MPLALRRSDNGAVVPVATLPFTLGSDRGDDLQVTDAGVRPGHARLRELRGDLLLSAADGLHVRVNGERVSFMVVQHGDRIQLGEPGKGAGTELVVRDRLAGAFLPPGVDRATAWLRSPAARDPAEGPEAYTGGPLAGHGSRTFSVRTGGLGRAQLKVRRSLDPDSEQPQQMLRLLQALAGAPHPNLAPLLDGGVVLRAGRALPWMLTRYVTGRPLVADARGGGLSPGTVVNRLVDAGRGLAHLHRRGVIHRDVAPGNLICTPRGHIVLIDYGQSALADQPVPASKGVIGTPGYVAPEEVVQGSSAVTQAVDVYGLAAVGFALLAGTPPAQGADLLDTLARAAARPPTFASLGVEVPAALEAALLEALDPDPTRRPTMERFVHALDFARVTVGL